MQVTRQSEQELAPGDDAVHLAVAEQVQQPKRAQEHDRRGGRVEPTTAQSTHDGARRGTRLAREGGIQFDSGVELVAQPLEFGYQQRRVIRVLGHELHQVGSDGLDQPGTLLVLADGPARQESRNQGAVRPVAGNRAVEDARARGAEPVALELGASVGAVVGLLSARGVVTILALPDALDVARWNPVGPREQLRMVARHGTKRERPPKREMNSPFPG